MPVGEGKFRTGRYGGISFLSRVRTDGPGVTDAVDGTNVEAAAYE